MYKRLTANSTRQKDARFILPKYIQKKNSQITNYKYDLMSFRK